MRRKKAWILAVLVSLCVIFPACTSSGPPGAHVCIDWVDVVRVNGTTYTNVGERKAVDVSSIGSKIGTVQFTVSGNVSDPSYRLKNEDATFLSVGTELYSVANNPGAIVAKVNGEYCLYTCK